MLPSSSTMDDRNELISRDNSRILQFFQRITFRRKVHRDTGAKENAGTGKRSGSATPFRACGWYGAVKEGKRPSKCSGAWCQYSCLMDRGQVGGCCFGRLFLHAAGSVCAVEDVAEEVILSLTLKLVTPEYPIYAASMSLLLIVGHVIVGRGIVEPEKSVAAFTRT